VRETDSSCQPGPDIDFRYSLLKSVLPIVVCAFSRGVSLLCEEYTGRVRLTIGELPTTCP
jgi:hypothetical protein